MATLDVLNSKGQKAGSVELADAVFKVKAPSTLIHEVVTAYLANQRRGTHSTKTRGEVSGGGLKPWKQKHTGNARAGSIRSPLWRKGGITFGPKPRSYVQAVPPAKRRLALRAVLSSFVADGKLTVVDQFLLAEPKTKHVAAMGRRLEAGTQDGRGGRRHHAGAGPGHAQLRGPAPVPRPRLDQLRRPAGGPARLHQGRLGPNHRPSRRVDPGGQLT
jgi:large subunit ribosomal protein L4